MENFYEETMPLSTTKDYSLYFISETLPLFDKLNFLIKKGEPFQRQSLLSNLSLYADNISLFPSLLTFLISSIELWDISTQLCFPLGLFNTIHDKLLPSHQSYHSLMNTIIKHFLFAIVTFEETVSNEYIYYFTSIIDHITQREKAKVIITDEVYSFIYSLGKFGQCTKNRRACVNFCSSIMRIDNNIGDDNSRQLMNRFIILCSDNEREVKLQVAYEIRFIYDIFFNINGECNEIDKVIEELINEDNDHLIQTEAICSFCIIFGSIMRNRAIVNVYSDKIKEIINNEKYESILVCQIVKELINCIMKGKNDKQIEFVNNNDIINDFIRRSFNGNINDNEEGKYLNDKELIYIDTILDCFEGICFVLSYKKDKGDLIDNIFTQISSFSSLGVNEKYRKKYYEKIHLFIPYTSKKIIPLLLSQNSNDDNSKIFPLFAIGNIENILSNQNFPLLISQLIQSKIHTSLINVIIDNCIKIDIDKLDPQQSYNLSSLAKGIKKLIPYIYVNTSLKTKKEDIYNSISSFVKMLLSKSIGHHIKSSFISIFPLLIKFSKNRDYYIKYIIQNYSSNESFYTRRLMRPFIEESFNELSLKFNIEKKLWDLFLKGINDTVPSLSCSYISLIKSIYKAAYSNDIGMTVIKIIKTKKDKNNMLPNEKRDTQLNSLVDSINEYCKNQRTDITSNDKEIKKYLSEMEIKNKENERNPKSLSNNSHFNYTGKVVREVNYIGNISNRRSHSRGKMLPPVKKLSLNSKVIERENVNYHKSFISSNSLGYNPKIFNENVKKEISKRKGTSPRKPAKKNLKFFGGNDNGSNSSRGGERRRAPIKFVVDAQNKI